MVSLRPYQSRALESLREHSKEKKRLLLLAPTGSGKTVLAAAIIHSARRRDARVLFFAHRLELVDQAVNQLGRWGVDAGVIRADDSRTNRDLPVQVATIQTLSRRHKPPADIVFIDEAHRAASDSYKKIIAAYPGALIIGLTATPCRLDGKPLGDVFEVLEVSATYKELMSDGFVVEPIVYSARQAVDLSGVHTRAGDYAEDELEQAMLDPKIVGSVVEEWRNHADGRRSVVFACTIAHAKVLLERFLVSGARAEHLDGTTPLEERRAILERLESGQTEVVTNVGVLTEGWDQPAVKCISIARPTQSLALWMQMAGRVMRPWHPEGPVNADRASVRPVVLDHGANVDRHGLPHEDRIWSLETRARRVKERSEYHVCKGCYAYVKKNPCELCGFAPAVEPRKITEDTSVKLTLRDDSDREGFFLMHLETARTRGFKPGYAAARYKEKFNSWPPWSWSMRAKREFESDLKWQGKIKWREMRALEGELEIFIPD